MKIKEFFRTSPMEKKEIIIHLIILNIGEGLFVWAATSALLKNWHDYRALLLLALGAIFWIASFWKINPEVCRNKFLAISLPINKAWRKFSGKIGSMIKDYIRKNVVEMIPNDSRPNHLIDH